MNNKNYKLYIDGFKWNKRKNQYIDSLYTSLCEVCEENKWEHVHHQSYLSLDYENPGSELDEHLLYVCTECHHEIHNATWKHSSENKDMEAWLILWKSHIENQKNIKKEKEEEEKRKVRLEYERKRSEIEKEENIRKKYICSFFTAIDIWNIKDIEILIKNSKFDLIWFDEALSHASIKWKIEVVKLLLKNDKFKPEFYYEIKEKLTNNQEQLKILSILKEDSRIKSMIEFRNKELIIKKNKEKKIKRDLFIKDDVPIFVILIILLLGSIKMISVFWFREGLFLIFIIIWILGMLLS